jgi:hypothetical protein
MLHDLDQAQHRAEDADGGREAAGGLEDRGEPLFVSMVESRLTRMILRNSLGSVPSTASMRVCLRKGSWMVCRSLSSETTPLRRALLAKATSWRMSWSLCLRGAAKTCARLRMRPHGGQRELQQHRAHGAAKDDQRRGRLQNLAQVAAFDQQAGNDAGDGQEDSANARFIHELLL